jgi:hypothetical protein
MSKFGGRAGTRAEMLRQLTERWRFQHGLGPAPAAAPPPPAPAISAETCARITSLLKEDESIHVAILALEKIEIVALQVPCRL